MDFVTEYLLGASGDLIVFTKWVFWYLIQKGAIWIGIKFLSVGIVIALYYFSQSTKEAC
ncbi:hypothetical protein [Risungbinella massiliensis]|uniref:hypothetical protein n=1 Tax=Risungbinella massiliensis TaxID=1329796 RepID=UPI0012B611E7|nr:hypothetical protein [Risungbinella massiliensis]